MSSMDEAVEVKTRNEGEFLAHPGVTGVGVGMRQSEGGADEPVIQIFVSDLSSAPPIPERLEGVPVEVSERRFELH